MSASQPSKEAIFVDVPKVKNFKAKFQYNFFVPDEGVQGSITGVPKKVLERPSDAFDAAYIDQLATRVPRFVRFDFTPCMIPPRNNEVTDLHIRNNNLRHSDKEHDYIQKNLSKIMDEDYFANEGFMAINLNDQSIDTKLFHIISGTAMLLVDERAKADAQSQKQLARETNVMTSDNVDFQFLSKFLVRPDEDNTFFFENESQHLRSDVLEKLKEVNIHTMVNSKFFHDIVNTSIVNPHTIFSSDYSSLHAVSKTMQVGARARTTSDMLHDDYKTVVNFTGIRRLSATTSTTQAEAKVIGYVIDKVEIMPDGKQIHHDPIVLESPYVSTAIDFNVKYYATYIYSMRTIAEFSVPTIVDDSGELVVADLLISSHPTRRWQVQCVDFRPPPSPTDFNFHFDHELGQLVLSWTYPPSQERDVKQFQVFRRRNINEPFQLMQVYDFNDAIVPADPVQYEQGVSEIYHPDLVIKSTSPSLMWADPDFKKDSKYIYALACMDAHGLSSNYSDQFEVTFDRFKNRVVKKRISSSGAPKPYPNLYLDSDTFVDLMHDNGHKTMTVIFNPDHLGAFNNQRQNIRLLTTAKDGGKYRFSIINTDIQIERTLDVTVDDKRLYRDLEKKTSKRLK